MATSTRKPKGKTSTTEKPQAQPAAQDESVIAKAASKPRRSTKTRITVAPEQPAEAEPVVAIEQAVEKVKVANRNGNSVGYEVIQLRAYEIFIERGGEHGRDLEDWFRAEEEIRNRGSEES